MLEMSNVTMRFRDKTALQNMTIDIGTGEIVALVGNNGAGKTTLMNIIMGYLKPTSGETKVFGENPRRSELVACKAMMCDEKMEYAGLIVKLSRTINEHAAFNKNFDKALCLKIMDEFQLKPNRYYGALSKGMRNQFNIAIALASNAQLLLMDEPTSGLDEMARHIFKAILNKETSLTDKTFIISTHLLGELQSIATKILLIKDNGEYVYGNVDSFANLFIKIIGRSENILAFIDGKKITDMMTMTNITSCIIANDLTYQEKKIIKSGEIDIEGLPANECCRLLCNERLFEVKNV